jgi:mono/diheme cytochrome c family protein
VEALYAYFLRGVEPAAVPNREADIAFPLSMRWPLTYWRLAFAPKPEPFKEPAANDPTIAVGAYLVEGLGHCGECHTPRNAAMQVRAQNPSDGTLFLSGAPIENWFAPSLRNDGAGSLADWSEDEIAEFLSTGVNHAGASFGSMGDVIANSTQYLSATDAIAIARYLKSLGNPDGRSRMFAYDDLTDQKLRDGDASARGALLYLDNCAACHRPDGRGYAEVFPSLAGNPVVESDDLSIVSIVLSGSMTPRTAAAPAQFHMPSFAWRLSNEEIADIATFVRSSWGNRAPPVEANEVNQRRKIIASAR